MDRKLLENSLHELADGQIGAAKMRHDAFWGALEGKYRDIANAAAHFFSLMQETNSQQGIAAKSTDEEKRVKAHRLSLELAAGAAAQFRRFAELAEASDRNAAIERLDRLIKFSIKQNYPLAPSWWNKLPQKDSAYFVSRIEEMAKMRDKLVSEAAAESSSKRKGGAR